jgi:hypothetical protein
MTRLLLSLVFLIFVTGCATPALDPNYEKYLATTEKIQSAQASRPQQALVRIKAQPGVSIQLIGVDEFVVYSPEVAQSQSSSSVATYVAPTNPVVSVVDRLAGVAEKAIIPYAAAKALVGVARETRLAGTEGYQYVQAPQANITNTVAGNGVIGSGTYSNIGGDGVNGAGSLSSLSGTGVLGSGTYNTLNGTGTTGAGSYAGPTTTTTTTTSTTTTTTDNTNNSVTQVP